MWLRVLSTGFLLYVLGVVVLSLTRNPNLFPTVILLGNFLVPVAFVAFFFERQHLGRVSLPTLATAFFFGGVLGVFAASLLEPLFIRRLDLATAVGVGLIEEFAKVLGIFVVARAIRHDAEVDGILLGAAAGMGFAALESTGYAFTAFLRSRGDLTLTVGLTLLRGLLSPAGHGTWTAILTGVLFRESAAHRWRLTASVMRTYFTVAILHGLWDGLPSTLATLLVPGLDIVAAAVGVAALGFLILRRRWVEALRLESRTPPDARPG